MYFMNILNCAPSFIVSISLGEQKSCTLVNGGNISAKVGTPDLPAYVLEILMTAAL